MTTATADGAMKWTGRCLTITDQGNRNGRLDIGRQDRVLTGSWDCREEARLSLKGVGLAVGGRLWFARNAYRSGEIGVVHYTLEDGNLRALWSTVGDKTLCYGIGTRTDGCPDDFAGVFHVAYTYADGSLTGDFTLTIERSGPLHVLTWAVGVEPAFKGIGLVRGGALGAAWIPGDTAPESLEVAVFPDVLAAGEEAGQGEWARSGLPATRPELIHGLTAR